MKKRILAEKIKFAIDLLRVLICFPVGYLLYLKKEIYIVCERGTDARDNGYHMFKYIVEHHPEKNVYYIIDKNSVDYNKVASLGHVIDYKSWKHVLYFVAARKKISSHAMGYAPGRPYLFSKIQRYFNVPGKHIFLQHGVIDQDLFGLHADKVRVDLFCCGARPEYEFIKEVFGHPEGVVCYTGLARYDNLHDYVTANEILVMPTWRMYLSNLSKQEFMRSDYYIHWNEFLNDQRLSALLNKYDLRLIFYPHYEMQKFVDCFSGGDENIVIANFDGYDVQKLLMDAKLLITDYSSVFFDIAYMKKPCVYYQFDENEYHMRHYRNGKQYFEFSRNGFGLVAENTEELLEALKRSIELDFTLEKQYAERTESFFELHDTHNCERIFEAIEALK